MRCPLYPPNVKDKPLGQGTRDLSASCRLAAGVDRLLLQAMRVCLAIRQRIQDRFLRHFLPADTTLIVYGPTGKPYRCEGKRTS